MNINNIIKEAYNKWENKEYIFEKINNEYKSITYGDFIKRSTDLAKNIDKNECFVSNQIKLIDYEVMNK